MACYFRAPARYNNVRGESSEPDLKIESDCSDTETVAHAGSESPVSSRSPSPLLDRRIKHESSRSPRAYSYSPHTITEPVFESSSIKREESCERASFRYASSATAHENIDALDEDSDVKCESSEEFSTRNTSSARLNATLKDLRKERTKAQTSVTAQKRNLKVLQKEILDKDIEIQRQAYRIEDYAEIKREVLRKWQAAKKVKDELVREKIDTETKLDLARDIQQRDEGALKELRDKIFHLEERLQRSMHDKVKQKQPSKWHVASKKRKGTSYPAIKDTLACTKPDVSKRRKLATAVKMEDDDLADKPIFCPPDVDEDDNLPSSDYSSDEEHQSTEARHRITKPHAYSLLGNF